MRKTLSLVLSIVMVLSLAIVGISAADATEIKTAEEFAAMAADGNYKLGADITLTATYGDGETKVPFTGTLDGNGHTVTVSLPVFYEMDGTLKNLTVKGAVTNSTATYTAAVALISKGGTFENITNEASVINTYALASATKNEAVRTGGIVAYIATTATTLTNCVNKGEVSGAEATGGIAGESQTKGVEFIKCVNYGKISVPVSKVSGVAGGGILGYNGTASVTFTDCINYGDIATDYRAGGIVGDARKAAVCTGCANYGKLVGANTVGGIIGYDGDSETKTPTIIKNCINCGELYDTNQVGGLVGYVYGTTTAAYVDVDGCINNGTISGGKYCSEFVGYSNSWNNQIKNSIGVGELKSVPVEGFPTRFCIMGCSSTQVVSMIIENVYIADGGKTEWFTWAAFTSKNDVADVNAKNRIPLSACLGKDLNGVEYEYPVYTSADYTAPASTQKITASADIGATSGGEPVGVRVKAITRIELNADTVKAFATASGVNVKLENGKVLFGSAEAPETGDSMIWVAVIALVSIMGMGIAVKAKNN